MSYTPWVQGDTEPWATVNANFSGLDTQLAAITGLLVLNEQTDDYTLVITDADYKRIDMNKGSANTLTIPPQDDVEFLAGTLIYIRQVGTGQTTIVAGDGVTINVPAHLTLKMRGQDSIAVLMMDDDDEWTLSGDLEPSSLSSHALSISSGVVDINCALGDYFTLALTENVTSITFSNLPGSGKAASKMVHITQDSTPRTVAWPSSFKWAGAVAGAVSTGSGAKDVLAITTFDNGTAWNATLAKAFA